MPFFIDIEASGLAGYPVEVGWVTDDFTHGGSILIRPDDEWPAAAPWDHHAEAIHGIALDRLRAEGVPVAEASQAVNEALSGQEAFSDNPGYEMAWLAELHHAAGERPDYWIGDVADLIADAKRDHRAVCEEKDIAGLADAMAGEAGLLRHRAFDDAARLALVYGAVRVLSARQASGREAGCRLRDRLIAQARSARARWGEACSS